MSRSFSVEKGLNEESSRMLVYDDGFAKVRRGWLSKVPSQRNLLVQKTVKDGNAKINSLLHNGLGPAFSVF